MTANMSYVPPGGLHKIPEYDPTTREHFWTAMVLYRVGDPARMYEPEGGPFIMDRENLALVGPVGCYHCEEQYQPGSGMEKTPCPGDPESAAESVIANLLGPALLIRQMQEAGVPVGMALVSSDPDAGGFEVTCGECGMTARAVVQPPEGKVLLCPTCQRKASS